VKFAGTYIAHKTHHVLKSLLIIGLWLLWSLQEVHGCVPSAGEWQRYFFFRLLPT